MRRSFVMRASVGVGITAAGLFGLNKCRLKPVSAPKPIGLFAQSFPFEKKIAESTQKITCDYALRASSEIPGEFDVPMERIFKDIPVDVAIQHIEEEEKAFRNQENLPHSYLTSPGFPRIWWNVDGCIKRSPLIYLGGHHGICDSSTFIATLEAIISADAEQETQKTRATPGLR